MKICTKIWLEDEVGFIDNKEVLMVSPQIAIATDKEKETIDPFFYKITDEVGLFKKTEITVSDDNLMMGLSPVQWMELNKGLLSDSLKKAINNAFKDCDCPKAAVVKDNVAIIGQRTGDRIILSLQIVENVGSQGNVNKVKVSSNINRILKMYGFSAINEEEFVLVDPENVDRLVQKRWIGGWYF